MYKGTCYAPADLSSLSPHVLHAGRDQSEINYVLLPEVLDYAARLDRILTQPGGSLLVVGRSGAGRRTLLQLMAYAHNIVIATPKITRSYALKHFKTDLKLVCAVLFFRLFFPSSAACQSSPCCIQLTTTGTYISVQL